MANILGDLDVLTGLKNLSLRYVLDVEEWKELIRSSTSLPQLGNVWSRIVRIEPKLRDTDFGNFLIRAFGKRGCLRGSLQVFDAIIAKNTNSWLLVLYSFALARCFHPPTRKSSLEDAEKRFESGGKSQRCWNSMLAAYAQNGHLSLVRQLFHEMPARDIVSWSSMLAATSLNREDDSNAAVDLFERMPSWDQASWTALLAAHARAGNLDKAIAVFDSMPCRDVPAWNIVFAAHSHRGDFKTGMELRRVMDLEGGKPDELSFVSLLLGCSSRDTARRCFWLMIRDYHIAPVKLHYGCMADLFHRWGYRKKKDMESFKASIPDESSDWVERILDEERR